MPQTVNGDTKTINDRQMFRVTPIKLDASGNLPVRFMVAQTGKWPTSVKGNFEITLDDLKEMKANFDAGIGFPTEDASTGLAIDFMHNYDEQAAGWVKALELEANETDQTGKLWASQTEWTTSGTTAVQGGEFKCISPAGYFGKRNGKASEWPNPNNLSQKVKNVLDGFGLTNIPFLRGMSPVRADASDGNKDKVLDYDKVLFISENNDQKKEGDSMSLNIDEVRVIDREALTVPQLDFLVENKDKLSAEELTKFKLDARDDDSDEKKETISPEDKETLSAIKDGSKKLVDADSEIVTKDELSQMKQTTDAYRNEKAEAVVDKHVARGAIVADAKPFWVKQLLSADGDERTALEEQLAALKSDEKVANGEVGKDGGAVAGNTRDQLAGLAANKIKAAKEKGVELSVIDAQKEVLAENPDLAEADRKDQSMKPQLTTVNA